MSQTQAEEASKNKVTVIKEQRYTHEEAEITRDLYGSSVSYVLLQDTNLKPPKPSHVFYSHFLQSLKYVETNIIPIAAMSFRPSDPYGSFMINPRNAKNLDICQFAGTVVHELLHLIFGHTTTDELRTWPKLTNIAMDMAINQIVLKDQYKLPWGKGILTDAPEDFECEPCLPDTVAKKLKMEPPPLNETWQFYLKWLINVLEEYEKNKQPCGSCGGTGQQSDDESGDSSDESDEKGDSQDGQGGSEDSDQESGGQGEEGQDESEQESSSCGKSGSHNHSKKGKPCPDCKGHGSKGGRGEFDDLIDELNGNTNHDHWEFDDLTPEEQEIVKRYVAQAAQEAARSSGGEANLPGSIQSAYKQLVKVLEPKIDWSNRVREFAGNAGKLTPYVRRNRINKKGLPGVLDFQFKGSVGVVLDTSGSVSDDEYGVFLAECVALSRDYDMEIWIQETSYGTTAPMWRLSEEGLKDFYDRNGYGGTNMKPGVMEFIQQIEDRGEVRVGGIIVFSDGELGHDSIVTPEELSYADVPLMWVFSRKMDPFAGKRYAGEIIYFDKEEKSRF